jgi:uncharacterized DUF497 family protein
MRVEYDPVKAGANLRKHGVSLADAAGVLDDALAVTVEDRNTVGERRFVTIGMSSGSEILVVVYTERNEIFRLISARRATRKERSTYEG